MHPINFLFAPSTILHYSMNERNPFGRNSFIRSYIATDSTKPKSGARCPVAN